MVFRQSLSPHAVRLRALLLLAPAVAVFAPGLEYPFLALDDLHHVVHNPAIRDLSWDGIGHLFFGDVRDLRYFPVSYLSFAIDYRLFGLDASAFHITNLLLHLANTLLVAWLVGRIFGDTALGYLTALLFSIHPLQVESVVWVMSRKNVLFLLFFLLAAAAYLGGRRTSGRPLAVGLLALSGSLYLLACLTKAAALPLPLALLLVDLARDEAQREPWDFLRVHLPSKLAYVPPGLLAVWAFVAYDAPNPFRTDFGFDLGEWVLITGHNFFYYVVKTAWPTGLAAFHPLPAAGALPGTFALYALGALALLGVTGLAIARGWRVSGFGLAWYLVTLAPNALYAAFFSDLPILVADRYFYQSAIGLLLLPSAAVLALWRGRPGWRPLAVVLAGAGVLSLAAAAAEHRRDWRSNVAIYRGILDEHPNDEFFYRLALAHHEAGRREEAFRALDAAATAPSKIFYLDFLYYRLALARVLLDKGDPGAAAEQVEAALAATPNAYEPFDARTPLAYAWLADLRERAGDRAGAARARSAAAAAAVDPQHGFEETWLRTLPDEADRFLRRRTRADPADGAAWFGLGIRAELAGRDALARSHYARAAARGYPPGSAEVGGP